MLNPIILNLETSDFFDTYNDSEFWQVNAKTKLIEMLTSTCEDAFNYKKSREINNKKISASHNAICISGSRGAGKTVFLRNAEAIWREAKITNLAHVNICDLYFLDTIDPTLLNGHDNFSNVIIAQLYNAVENKLLSPSVDADIKNTFYTSLKRLAESLGKKNDFADHAGIDRILKYRSGIQVETFFHEYVEECIKILNCKAIVILIDDVDMALNRAVEVLDEVRRLLSCPYIIPIVSGDHKLYSHMVSVHFEKCATDKQNTSEETTKSGHKIGQLLAASYLTKVFPNHLRLPLLPIERLLPHLLIKEKNTKNEDVSFAKYEKMLRHVFFYLCNGEERSTEYSKPNSAREVTQLIKSLTPSKLQQFETLDLWNMFKTWAEQKHHGATYTNAVSISQLSDYNSDETMFRFDQLLAFNPILQAKENISWADKYFLSEQEIVINDLLVNASRDLSGKVTRKNMSKIDDNMNIIKSVFTRDMKILRSMPALEMYSSAMTLTRETVNKDENNLLLAIYTHRDYYGTQGNKRYSIFFSRAFEILSTSILSISNNIKIEDWDTQLKQIIERVPFYSVHAMNPTKYLEQEGDDEELTSTNNTLITSESNQTYNDSTLVMQIKEWEIAHKDKLLELENLSLIPLLHSVFNKTFTQLHILRTEISKPRKHLKEYLTDTARRFEYIVINAFASLLREDYVIKANVAIGAHVKTLRDHKAFMSVDRTLSRNIKGMIDVNIFDENSNLKDGTATTKSISSILLEVIWAHPIFFNLNNSKTLMTEPKFPLSGGPISLATIEPTETKMHSKKAPLVKLLSLAEFKETLTKASFRTGRKDILEWRLNNKSEAKKIYDRVEIELTSTGVELREGTEQKRMFDALVSTFKGSDSSDSSDKS